MFDTNPYGNQTQRLNGSQRSEIDSRAAILHRFFRRNKNQWIKASAIQDSLGFNPRATRTLVENLRLTKTLPIASGIKGYKLTTDAKDLTDTIEPIQKSINSKRNICKSLIEARRDLTGDVKEMAPSGSSHFDRFN